MERSRRRRGILTKIGRLLQRMREKEIIKTKRGIQITEVTHNDDSNCYYTINSQKFS